MSDSSYYYFQGLSLKNLQQKENREVYARKYRGAVELFWLVATAMGVRVWGLNGMSKEANT